MCFQKISNPKEVQRYEDLMAELAIIVDQFGGSLKRRNTERDVIWHLLWKRMGAAAYDIMKRIKKIFDPKNQINPDVLINPDPKAHLKHLKKKKKTFTRISRYYW